MITRLIPRVSALRELHADRPLSWHDYADLWLSFPLGKLLDYGCGSGDFIRRIRERADECWGVDIDPDRLAQAARLVGVKTRSIKPGELLPFNDGKFDTVVSMEVIEHVADERALLRECARVLAPGGRLLLTTPHRGLLTFLDPGNVKFIAPGIHRFIHCTILRHKDSYQQRFGRVRKTECRMIADFALDQSPWHRHYRYSDIRTLAPGELETLAWAVYYPAFRALWTLRLVVKVLTFGRIGRLPPPFGWITNRLSRVRSLGGDQLVVLFQKRKQPNKVRASRSH